MNRLRLKIHNLPKRKLTINTTGLILSTTSILLFYNQFYNQLPLLNEQDNNSFASQSQMHGGKTGTIKPTVFLWGRNTHNVASIDTPEIENIKKPKQVTPFDGQVLRDLVLHETYGIAVDANGDVIQWGLGSETNKSSSGASSSSSSTSTPRPTLLGKDIMTVAVSEHKIFALSRKGEIFIFPVGIEEQNSLEKGGLRSSSNNSWFGSLSWLVGGSGNVSGAVYEKLLTDTPLARGEKFISISTGSSHLLALTSNFRAFASPLSLTGNAYGQLGVKKCILLSSSNELGSKQIVTLIPDPTINEIRREIAPPSKLDPLLLPMNVNSRIPSSEYTSSDLLAPPSSSSSTSLTSSDSTTIKLHSNPITSIKLEKSIHFSTILHEIPSLKSVRITQLQAGDNHSLALTAEGRVLGWGANGYGQLGLGASLSFPSIPTPTEIPLTRVYPKATRMECIKIAAGGLSSYFVVETEDIRIGRRSIDLLAAGNGQFGGIGNGSWAHAASPMKVKTISGLQEWSDIEQKVEPIPLKEVSVGKNHIAIVLDNAVEQPGGIKFGRDVFVWGQNEFYQLGTGKRSNLSTPQHLPPLPYAGLITPTPDDLPSSGTTSPMPHNRMQLAPEMKLKGGQRVEETIVAGDGGSAVYWRIINP